MLRLTFVNIVKLHLLMNNFLKKLLNLKLMIDIHILYGQIFEQEMKSIHMLCRMIKVSMCRNYGRFYKKRKVK
ncbi:hypothetical protein BAZSYMA_ACONTIG126469_1 [Bathymodiolus azoricus thioautotrophic gill symbiont]|uniref:Uncharacterized protein n=1 Tax=Bathymodiolus azoricus thioautotrophic gill symbiont TaxID=235205 RepID=A0A1H6M9P1_9GAMM|nr:hypothetical protein BAZSYMA_ACONTIG126469_1 [Bathymodiolus azoricus thioautotrophic gill symbiont]